MIAGALVDAAARGQIRFVRLLVLEAISSGLSQACYQVGNLSDWSVGASSMSAIGT
jgi:hypothetical protein